MKYDISNPEDRSNLERIVRVRIQAAKSKHTEMHSEWDEADDYYENDQIPPGFSDQHKEALANANDPTQGNPSTKQYVVHNRVLRSHLGVLGEFVEGKQNIIVRGRSPKDRKLARVFQKELEYVQDKENIWDEKVVPTVDCGTRRGIHWLKVWFDPEKNLPWGKIEVRELSCRDVMLDPASKGYFYQDANYRVHRMRMRVEDANLKYAEILELLELGQFSADNEYDQPYGDGIQQTETDQYTTIYEIQYKEFERRYFKADGEDLTEIGQDEFDRLSTDPETAETVFTQKEDVYYVAWYNEGLGILYNEENEFGQYTLIPFMNIRSEGRLYPIGTTKYEKNLQDLVNVLLSVMLDNQKRGNKGIYQVDPTSYAQYADQIVAAVTGKGPNIIPAVSMNHFKPNELTQAIVSLYQMIGAALDDTQSQHELTKGQMPRERLAKQTVELILAQDRKGHGLKDVMIRRTLTEFGKLLYKIIRMKWKEEHWILVTDASKQDPDYVPINFVLSEQEYFDMMMELAGLKVEGGETNEEIAQIEQAALAFQKKFESENEVRTKVEKLYIFNTDEGEQRMSQEELEQQFIVSHMTQEEFMQAYRPAVMNIPLYVVNKLDKDVDMDVVFDVDFDVNRDRQMKMNMAFAAFDRGTITGLEFLKAIEYPNAEQAWADAERRNQIVQLGEMVAANPELQQLVVGSANQLERKESDNKSNGKPKPKKSKQPEGAEK